MTASESARVMAPRCALTDGERTLEALLREAATLGEHELKLETLAQGALTERKHECALPTQGDPIAHRPDWQYKSVQLYKSNHTPLEKPPRSRAPSKSHLFRGKIVIVVVVLRQSVRR
jgi:hypothetical protein